MYVINREVLEQADPQDLTEEQSKNIYSEIARAIDEENRMKKMYLKDK